MATPTNCYNMRYLGCAPVSKFIPGLGALQKPLHELYVSYLTPKGPRQPVVCRLALTDRGIILTANAKDSFYSMRDILLWEPVLWVHVLTKDKKIMSAFEPLSPDHHLSQEGLFSKLDSQYKYLAQLRHEPVLAMVLKKDSGTKQMIDVHAFMCGSDAQVFEVAQALWKAEQLFIQQESAGGMAIGNCPPGGQNKEVPKSVRSSSGGSKLGQAEGKGKQSARQGKGRKTEGEITLEELIRLADRALAEPGDNAGQNDPPFRMGESWAAKDQKGGVQRSRTFNDGPIRREPGDEVPRRGRDPSPNPVSDVQRGNNNGNPSQRVPYYENVAAPNSGQPRTYENVSKNPGIIQVSVQPEVLHNHSDNNHLQVPQVDPKRKSVPPDSLRGVIAESKIAKQRVSVLPVSEFGNFSGAVSNLTRPIVDIYTDQDESHQANPSPKPVALVQPRKVPRYKVLPEAAPEAILLQKVPGRVHEEPKKEQYQMGAGSAGNVPRSYTRSMYELNNISVKPTTPQAQRKAEGANHEFEHPTRKFMNSELNLAAGSSSPNSARKIGSSVSVPESKSGDKGKPDRETKDAEMKAFAMNVNFERVPVNTISPHGTNFENALGYFP